MQSAMLLNSVGSNSFKLQVTFTDCTCSISSYGILRHAIVVLGFLPISCHIPAVIFILIIWITVICNPRSWFTNVSVKHNKKGCNWVSFSQLCFMKCRFIKSRLFDTTVTDIGDHNLTEIYCYVQCTHQNSGIFYNTECVNIYSPASGSDIILINRSPLTATEMAPNSWLQDHNNSQIPIQNHLIIIFQNTPTKTHNSDNRQISSLCNVGIVSLHTNFHLPPSVTAQLHST